MFPAATVDETMEENVKVAAAVGGLVVVIIFFSLGLLWCKHSEYVLLHLLSCQGTVRVRSHLPFVCRTAYKFNA